MDGETEAGSLGLTIKSIDKTTTTKKRTHKQKYQMTTFRRDLSYAILC